MFFPTWLHRNGEDASFDQLRPIPGHKDRSATDRYVTVNRSTAGKVLFLLPNIRKSGQKKMAQDKLNRNIYLTIQNQKLDTFTSQKFNDTFIQFVLNNYL